MQHRHPTLLALAFAAVAAACAADPSPAPQAGPEDTGGSGGGPPRTGGKGGGSGGAGGQVAGGAGGQVAGGSGGGGSAAGSGGQAVPDAAVADASQAAGGASVDAGGSADVGTDAGLSPLEECKKPSIDRIQEWNATNEGSTTPMNGTLLVKEGDRYVAKEIFKGNEWHVLEVLIANAFEAQVDLGASKGFTLTYNTTADLWVQLRPASKFSGGDKWVTAIPSTSGQTKQQFFPFTPESWTTIPELGKPGYTLAAALKEARGLLFVGKTPNTITISGLRIDGYTPMCR